MTATLRPEVGTLADKLQEAVEDAGLTDVMPNRFWNELVDYGIETVEQFEHAYAGQYASAAVFSKELCDDCGYLSESNLPTYISNHIDWDAVWNYELRFDYFRVEGRYPDVYYYFCQNF